MKLHHPFVIGPRLAPAVQIKDSNGTAWLSYENDAFVIDLPDGSDYMITDFRPGYSVSLQSQFASILGFLSACAESRSYAERKGKNPMEGENSDLFPSNVGEWAQQYSSEIDILRFEIEESETDLIEG